MLIFNKKKYTQDDKVSADNLLHQYLTDGDVVYVRLLSRSKSGMSRRLSLHLARDKRILDVTYASAVVLNESTHDVQGHNAIRIDGCGMDMGFALVDRLAHKLSLSLKHSWIWKRFRTCRKAGWHIRHNISRPKRPRSLQ